MVELGILLLIFTGLYEVSRKSNCKTEICLIFLKLINLSRFMKVPWKDAISDPRGRPLQQPHWPPRPRSSPPTKQVVKVIFMVLKIFFKAFLIYFLFFKQFR